VNKFR